VYTVTCKVPFVHAVASVRPNDPERKDYSQWIYFHYSLCKWKQMYCYRSNKCTFTIKPRVTHVLLLFQHHRCY